jgi:sodium-coupled neutral amino acid transporter 11
MNVARLCFAFNMFTTYPLECFVCREVTENYFFPGKPVSNAMNFIITASFVAATLAIALLTCNLGVVLELTGCFSATALAFILPPACYLKLASGPTLSWKKWPSLTCMIGGVIVMLISTGMTLQEAFDGDEGPGKECHW